VLYRIAKSYRALGNGEQVKVYYGKAIDENPDGVWPGFAEEELKEMTASD